MTHSLLIFKRLWLRSIAWKYLFIITCVSMTLSILMPFISTNTTKITTITPSIPSASNTPLSTPSTQVQTPAPLLNTTSYLLTPPLLTIRNGQLENGHHNISLSWDRDSNTNPNGYYEIIRNNKLIYTTSGTNNVSFSDNNVQEDEDYYYKIRAVSGNKSEESASKNIKIPLSFHPPSLDEPKASINSNVTVHLNWKEADQNFNGHYIIQRKDSWRFKTIASTKSHYYDDSEVKTNKEYSYRIIAEYKNHQQEGNEKTIKTPIPHYNFTHFEINNNNDHPKNLYLNWAGEGKGIKFFLLERKQKTEEKWKEIEKIKNIYKKEYIDKNISDNTYYVYRVSAILINKKIADRKTTQFLSSLGKVKNLKALVESDGGIKLSWMIPSNNVDHYRIYRYQAPNGNIIKDKKLFRKRIKNTHWKENEITYNSEFSYAVQAVDSNNKRGEITFSSPVISHYKFSTIKIINCIKTTENRLLIDWELPKKDLKYSDSFLKYELKEDDSPLVLCEKKNINATTCSIDVEKKSLYFSIYTINKNNTYSDKKSIKIQNGKCKK